mgnify:CR=1 FL=1
MTTSIRLNRRKSTNQLDISPKVCYVNDMIRKIFNTIAGEIINQETHRIVGTIGSHPKDMSDQIQEALIKAWEYISSEEFVLGDDPAAHIRGIIHQHLRWSRHASMNPPTRPVPISDIPIECDEFAAEEDINFVTNEFVEEDSPEVPETIEMYLACGKDMYKLADAMGVSRATAYIRLNGAKEELKDCALKRRVMPLSTIGPKLKQDPTRVHEVVARLGGNKTAAARYYGVSRQKIYRWLEKY